MTWTYWKMTEVGADTKPLRAAFGAAFTSAETASVRSVQAFWDELGKARAAIFRGGQMEEAA